MNERCLSLSLSHCAWPCCGQLGTTIPSDCSPGPHSQYSVAAGNLPGHPVPPAIRGATAAEGSLSLESCCVLGEPGEGSHECGVSQPGGCDSHRARKLPGPKGESTFVPTGF